MSTHIESIILSFLVHVFLLACSVQILIEYMHLIDVRVNVACPGRSAKHGEVLRVVRQSSMCSLFVCAVEQVTNDRVHEL